MLFNSYEFIFLFLPAVLIGFFWIGRSSHRLAALWLVLASLFFYGYWNPKFVTLLMVSVGFNYAMAYAIARAPGPGRPSYRAIAMLTLAVAVDLAMLGYFKYANFFIETANQLFTSRWPLTEIVLPIGISFFTFTQIAFLVDVNRGLAREYNFVHYLLFVTYFPHLIAGPVLHHKQIMPQFANRSTFQISAQNLAVGLTIFTIGLAKKILLADSLADYAAPVFDAVRDGAQPTLVVAWAGALAYTFQLYFDFSGYSDMAIGLSRMVGVQLPINFNSPYKAPSIIEFWRRWHMTLSQFLKDYLYISLGGNRRGAIRRHLNILVTMLLGGLWHGASWTFVVWGGIHGLYLVINNIWRALREKADHQSRNRFVGLRMVLSTGITFVAVVVAWVFFRAANISAAVSMLEGMGGRYGISLPRSMAPLFQTHLPDLATVFTFEGLTAGIPPHNAVQIMQCLLLLFLCAPIVFWAPNTQTIVAQSSPTPLGWRPSLFWALAVGITLGFSLLCLNRSADFLYFQF